MESVEAGRGVGVRGTESDEQSGEERSVTSEDSQSRVDGLAQSNAEDNGALQAALAKADAGPAAPRLPGIAATGVLQPLDPFADQTASTTQARPARRLADCPWPRSCSSSGRLRVRAC